MRRLLLAATILAAPAAAQDRDAQTARIIDEGTNHSQAMPTVQQMTNVIDLLAYTADED